jgi:hypothetical protein
VVAGCLLAGCSDVDAPGTTNQAPAASTQAGQPGSTPQGAASRPVADEPASVADIFPAGGQREAVLNNCASCHNVACAAIGQRSAERWDALKESHRENVPGVDLDALFGYLKANFDATKPEPRVPPRFLEGGCTPF